MLAHRPYESCSSVSYDFLLQSPVLKASYFSWTVVVKWEYCSSRNLDVRLPALDVGPLFEIRRINANPGLKVNRGFDVPCKKLFFTANVLSVEFEV